MKILYDTKLMRPGCVLLQAAAGNDPSIAHNFPSDLWLVTTTPDLKNYPITDVQLDFLIEKTKRHHDLIS